MGVGADVVFHTPFLRYLTLFGCIGASATSITKALKNNKCPGVVPDGIAGIFRLQAGGTGLAFTRYSFTSRLLCTNQ